MDSELAAHTGSRAARGKAGFGQLAQRGARLGAECFARLGQGHAALGACEQWDADFYLQAFDCLADARLRDTQPECRAREVKFLTNGQEGVDVTELH
jgi:hypothetical protein